MIFRYIIFILLVNGLGSLLNFIIYPISYIFRNFWRKNKSNWFCKFFWYFLHDGCDYGDTNFQERYSNLRPFIKSYKWSMRNTLHNLYYSLKTSQKDSKGNYIPEVVISSNTTCHREGVPDGTWRTIKTKNINDIFKDKHGEYIDYDQSIIGKQKYIFTLNGRKYFRYSKCSVKYIKWLNRIYVREYKFGYEYNWAIQNKFLFFKVDSKSLSEFNIFAH